MSALIFSIWAMAIALLIHRYTPTQRRLRREDKQIAAELERRFGLTRSNDDDNRV